MRYFFAAIVIISGFLLSGFGAEHHGERVGELNRRDACLRSAFAGFLWGALASAVAIGIVLL